MKALNMIFSKQTIVVAALAMAMFTTACQSSKNSGSVAQRNRNPAAGQNTLINQATGQPQATTTWGLITTGAGQFDPAGLQDFMWASGPIGSVSGNGSDGTGVVFRGLITQMTGGGQIEIMVKDATAVSTGSAYIRTLQVTQVSGGSTSATVTAVDASGSVTFSGDFNGSMWQGSVQYSNDVNVGGSGTPTSLGNFQISSCGIFQC